MNKKFWKTFKLLFGNKVKGKSQIKLFPGNNLVTDDTSRAKIFNKIFGNIAATLRIKYQKLKIQWIPLRIIKEFSDIFGNFLSKNFSECLDKGFFQYELICAKIVPLYKKKPIKKDKHNYRPVSILPNIYQNYMKVICISTSMNI